MVLQPHERETCMGWDNQTRTCRMITYNKALIKQLDAYCADFPAEYKVVNEIIYDGVVEGKEYTFPKNLITIRKPSKKRKLTEKQKKAAAERLKKAREKKGGE